MKRFILVAVFLFMVAGLIPSAHAVLKYYGVEDVIDEDHNVRNVITLAFNETISHLDYQLNFEISNLEIEANFDSADCSIEGGNTISCDFIGMSAEKNQLILSFDIKEGVKKVNGKFVFSANYGFLPTDKAFVLIRLPEYSRFSEDVINTSFFPQNGNIISDGKSIAVFWEREDIKDENLQFYVSYIIPQGIPSYIIISLTAIVVIVMVGVVVYARRKDKQPATDMITSVLNHDENVIVDILKREEGKALQKVLVRESNFSKAKVSRLVKDMKGRGIVNIEAVSGRENRIILSVGKKEAPEAGPKKEEPKTVEGKG
ncbi:MAG: hypothetical protein ISS93_02655 [Candidatus Aenigmarchaeota archaeon]|nr:hypothetical protein [Candidatus Aenigmarchaeota archaeon]